MFQAGRALESREIEKEENQLNNPLPSYHVNGSFIITVEQLCLRQKGENCRSLYFLHSARRLAIYHTAE